MSEAKVDKKNLPFYCTPPYPSPIADWGLQFYCHPERDADFKKDIAELME